MRSLVLAMLAVVLVTLALSSSAAADCADIAKALAGVVTELTCLESADLTTRNDATTPPDNSRPFPKRRSRLLPRLAVQRKTGSRGLSCSGPGARHRKLSRQPPHLTMRVFARPASVSAELSRRWYPQREQLFGRGWGHRPPGSTGR